MCVVRCFTPVFVLWSRRVRVCAVTPAVNTRVSRGLPQRLLDISRMLSRLPLALLPVNPPCAVRPDVLKTKSSAGSLSHGRVFEEKCLPAM
jgi:hypothetical protein